MKSEDRDVRGVIGTDQCIVDETWFLVRGCLEIPILGRREPFLWGLWASIRQEVFDEISDCWNQEGRQRTHGPFKGRIHCPFIPKTLNLKVLVGVRMAGLRRAGRPSWDVPL